MKRMAIGQGVLGLTFVVGPFFWGIDTGSHSLSAQEAWDRGLAQPTVLSGTLLILLAAFLFRGASWPRWPIVLWCPLSIGANIGWGVYRGYLSFSLSEFMILGLPVMAFWVWGTSRSLSGNHDESAAEKRYG